jgi:hypothetical protein
MAFVPPDHSGLRIPTFHSLALTVIDDEMAARYEKSD